MGVASTCRLPERKQQREKCDAIKTSTSGHDHVWECQAARGDYVQVRQDNDRWDKIMTGDDRWPGSVTPPLTESWRHHEAINDHQRPPSHVNDSFTRSFSPSHSFVPLYEVMNAHGFLRRFYLFPFLETSGIFRYLACYRHRGYVSNWTVTTGFGNINI